MRNILSIVRKVPKRMYAVVAVAAAVVTVPAALLAWGPSRPTYTTAMPADHVTFNSITDNPVQGDERNFVQVKEAGAANSTYTDNEQLIPGKTYTMFMYYHNNAASNLNASGVGIAKDVSAKAELPAIVKSGATGTKAVGYINASNANASNAQPTSVWDDVSFSNVSGGDIALRYVPGSATIHNQGATNGAKLSDSIVTSGAALGYDSLNGVVPGCNQYAGYVTFDFVADQANFTVSKQVRKTGTTTWQKSVAVNPGDSVDYLISYKNTGTTDQNNVVVKDQLPAGMTYATGSAKLANPAHPSGVATDDGVTTTGLNIGSYPAGSNAFLVFSAKVATKDTLPCGPQTLTNTATIDTNNGGKSDTANVTVTGNECQPQPIQVCNLTTKQIVTIDEKDFDSSKYSKNLADCATVNKINVCELATKTIVTINESDFDASKYSKNLADCTPTTTIQVCEIKTGRIVTIQQSDMSSSYSTNLSDCNQQPSVPALLPHTGPADMLAKLSGVVSLTAATAYYVASRRN